GVVDELDRRGRARADHGALGVRGPGDGGGAAVVDVEVPATVVLAPHGVAPGRELGPDRDAATRLDGALDADVLLLRRLCAAVQLLGDVAHGRVDAKGDLDGFRGVGGEVDAAGLAVRARRELRQRLLLVANAPAVRADGIPRQRQ